MTQEQKAKAYDKAKYIMKEYIESGNAGVIAEKTIKRAFPELEESEDERIRKAMIDYFKWNPDGQLLNEFSNREVFAWLEKQGQESRKVSIWKHWKDGIAGNGEGKPIYLVKMGNTYSLTSCLGFECDYIELSELDNLMLEKQGEQKPIDKVEPKFKVKYADNEYNVLYVKDIAGVTFYGIEDEPNHIDYVLPDNCEIISEQKPTWSEEDNKHLERILKELENQRQRPSNRPYLEEIESDYNWLNSIKDRVQSKLEWSKEDKEMLTEIIIDLKALKNRDTGEAGKAAYQREIDWLESLRPQAQWKPSDEQIKVLEFFIPYVTKCSIVLEKSKGTLLSLLSDLKKLKG